MEVASRVNGRMEPSPQISRFRSDPLTDLASLESLLQPLAHREQCRALAERLLAREGSLRAIFECNVDALAEIAGPIIAAHLKCINTAMRRMLLEDLKERPIVNCWSDLETYLRAAYRFDPVEKRVALFLNSGNLLIREEQLQVGPIDEISANLRRIAARALQFEASAVITVHNRPGRDAKPSASDVQMTKDTAAMLGMLGIALHDHAIIGKNGIQSLRAIGSL
jgi:DNA repair protein RadC